MTSNPDPYQPLNYNYGAPVVSLRPTAVTVLAVFGIVVSSLAILMNFCGGGLLIANQAVGGFQFGGVAKQPTPTTASAALQIGTAVLYLTLNVVYLLSSIGMLKLRARARRTTVTLSVAMLVLLPIWATLQLLIVAPDARRQMDTTLRAAGTTMPASTAAITNTAYNAGLIGGVVVGGVLSAVLPICNLVILPKARIKSAFGEA